MKNQFFHEMQRLGKKYKNGGLSRVSGCHSWINIAPPYTQGQSFAYMFWAIADHYNSNEVLIDELPSDDEIRIMLDTFMCAGIYRIAVKECDVDIAEKLEGYGCIPNGDCKVYRRETDLYQGDLWAIKGVLMEIQC